MAYNCQTLDVNLVGILKFHSDAQNAFYKKNLKEWSIFYNVKPYKARSMKS